MNKFVKIFHQPVKGLIVAICLFAVGVAHATPISQTRIAVNVDWCSAAISGTGGGAGTINLACAAGVVQGAYLYWHGIDNTATGAVYDNANIMVDGNPVTGISLGDATTNCWGDGSSRAFEADITGLVAGNGNYSITGLSSGTNHSSNGASLVVVYDDGDNTNNRDLVFFTGNDSNNAGTFPGEDDGWHATLPGINYGGGSVGAEIHVGDGQDFVDGDLEFETVNAPPFRIVDSVTLYDGISVPSAGTSRADNGELWDVHNYDTTAAFGGVPGLVTLNVDGLGYLNPLPGSTSSNDCLALVVMLLDLEPFSAPNEINLDPQSALNCTGTDHTVTATIKDTDGIPQEGENVTFLITSGPNIGATDNAVTDANGEASFTYTDTGLVAGTDNIEACFVDGDQDKCSNASKEWEVCNEPPDCTDAEADTGLACIWPPSHGFVDVSVIGVTDPDGDNISIEITGITSDEATKTEKGAGGATHAPDGTGVGTDTAHVRAERSGRNDGRVYDISFTADDGNGGQCSGTVQVGVPHDRRRKTCNAVDSGQIYDATQ